MVQVHGESFPALSILDPYKYLGLQVLATGTRVSVEEQLQFKLEQVTKAPLKPQQRMFILRTNILLALFHKLVLAETTEGYLNSLDLAIRSQVKKWLQLKATRSEDPILKAVAISDWFQVEMRSCESGQMMKVNDERNVHGNENRERPGILVSTPQIS